MYYENDNSVLLKREEQRKYKGAYHIHGGLLYHYAKCETLWKILESDVFFARNIRFSNDSNEYVTGREIIERFVSENDELNKEEKKKILCQIQKNPMMYYMVCFCKERDLLSQWRGYAKNGVSIGMDFTDGNFDAKLTEEHIETFCVLNNKRFEEIEKGGRYSIGKENLKFLQMPYAVKYTPKRVGALEDDIKDTLATLWNEGDAEERISRLLKYIPFVKDIGFKEEEEYRLIFDMEYLGKSEAHSNNVRSKKIEYIDSEGMKKPYIKVEFGNPANKQADVKYISIGKDLSFMADELEQSDIIKDKEIEIKRDENRNGIYIGEGKDQEKILEIVEKYVEAPSVSEEQRKQTKIWCKGHLPIREIIVGPGEKQEEIKESLEHYKKTEYWLRYIDIKTSEIPLRD